MILSMLVKNLQWSIRFSEKKEDSMNSMNICAILKSFKKDCLKKEIYNWLSGKKLSDEDYKNFLEIWNKFGMKTICT